MSGPYADIVYNVRTNADWVDSIPIHEPPEGDDVLGPPVDLTGANFVAHIRSKPESPSVYVECSTANGRLLVVDNAVAWNVPASFISRHLPPGTYTVDMVWSQPGRPDDVLIVGIVIVELGITR